MDIVSCTDNNYIMPLSVLLRSFEEYNNQEANTIHIISDVVLTDESKDALTESIINPKDKICFYYFDIGGISEITNIEIPGYYVTIATYIRLYIHKILPKNLHKVLYLDGDILICGNLQELWQTDISDKAIAAVEDIGSTLNWLQGATCYNKSFGYFNAGVLLVNLDYWRIKNIEEEFSDYAIKYQNQIVFGDQDILNNAFYNSKISLHPKYNVQYLHYWLPSLVPANDDPLVKEAVKQPIIIHFTTEIKPWKKWSDNPNTKLWRKWLKETRFRGTRPQKRKALLISKAKYISNVLLGLKIKNKFIDLA